jgi:hypothetical protein
VQHFECVHTLNDLGLRAEVEIAAVEDGMTVEHRALPGGRLAEHLQDLHQSADGTTLAKCLLDLPRCRLPPNVLEDVLDRELLVDDAVDRDSFKSSATPTS